MIQNALAELLRRSRLTPLEHDLAAAQIGLRPMQSSAPRYIVERLRDKLGGKTIGGKTIEQAVAEIAEVRS